MKIKEFIREDDILQLSPSSNKAVAWIKKVYSQYPGIWQNNHVMVWGEGESQQLAMFELEPSKSKKDAVEVKWFQAYPLRAGVGSKAMQELQKLAKEDDISLTLYPWDKGQVSQSKLIAFYKKHGFKPTTKGSKNMYWEPVSEEITTDKQFVIVLGGAGSGKNYFIKHDPVFSTYDLIDVDAIKGEMGVRPAIKAIKPMMIAAFEAGRCVAHPSTGSHLIGQKNKIALAHQYGYRVTLVLVDRPFEQAVAQVRQRAQGGGHDVDISAIASSNRIARENFLLLKGDADFSKIV